MHNEALLFTDAQKGSTERNLTTLKTSRKPTLVKNWQAHGSQLHADFPKGGKQGTRVKNMQPLQRSLPLSQRQRSKRRQANRSQIPNSTYPMDLQLRGTRLGNAHVWRTSGKAYALTQIIQQTTDPAQP